MQLTHFQIKGGAICVSTFKFILLFYSLTVFELNLNAQTNNVDNYATVYFIRETGYMGKAGAFKVFVDNDYICKISDNRFITTTITPGAHAVSAQYYGKYRKSHTEKFEFTAEAGKTYYFTVTQVTGAFVNNIFCEEITENSAKNKMKDLREDPDCR